MKFLRAILILCCVAFSANARAAVGDLVATLAVNGQSNVVFTLINNPNGYFAIQNGNQVVEAVNAPPGNYSIRIQAAAPGSSITQQFTLNYTPTAPPPYNPGFAVAVNFSGMENQYPTPVSAAEIGYYATRGIPKSRLPIGWSQSNPNYGLVGIQPAVNGAIDTTSTYLAMPGPNLLYNSQAIATSPWGTYSNGSGTITVTNNAGTAPDGSNTATLVQINRPDFSSYAEIINSFPGTAASYTGSFYLKANTSGDVGKVIAISLYINNGGIIVGEQNITLTNTWTRISTTAALLNSTSQITLGYVGVDGSSTGPVGFLAWCAQVNQGASAVACQPTTAGYVGVIDAILYNMHAVGASTLLDIHTFGNGPGNYPIGSSQVPISAFANLWQQISAHFMGNPAVRGYDLNNEPPNGFNSTTWFNAAQAAINAIRGNGDTTPIYVEGVNYSGAWNWVTGQGQPYNNSNQYQLVDPLNRMVISAHGYLDNDSSGSNFSWALETAKAGLAPPGTPTSATIGVTRETPFIAWAQSHGVGMHHGEIGWSNDALAAGGTDNYAAWNNAAINTINLIQANNYEVDIWGAGPSFGPGYPAYLGPSSVSNPGVSDFSSAGLQSTLLTVLEHYSGYSGPQPQAYRIDLPVTITSTSNPEAPIVTSVPYATSGTPTGNFAIRYGGVIPSGGVVITPHAYLLDGTTNAGGTFTPSTVTLPAGNNAIAYFTYTPSQAATIQITATNNAGWINPPALGISSQTSDPYRTMSSLPTNVYGMYLRYTPYIGPALTLQRQTDNTQMTFYYNNLGNLPRETIQTWASSNIIPIVTRYDQSPSGNNITYTATLPTLNLNNSAGYPEVDYVSGTHGTFNTPINNQTALSVIARMNQSSSTGGGLFRMDWYAGPMIWGGTSFELLNTGYVGNTLINSNAVAVGTVNLGITDNAYHENAFTYAAGTSNGLKTYVDGSFEAQATASATLTETFTGTQAGTNLTTSNVVGVITIGDVIAGTGVATGTSIVSQTSGTTGGAGVYVTSLSGTASNAALTGTGNNYILNAAFNATQVDLAWFQFGSQFFVGAETNLEFEAGQTLTLAQIDAINTADQNYYSTPLPDMLPAVPPTIIGATANQPIYPALYTSYPFENVTILDSNSGTPTDSVTITLSGAAGTLSGAGISGSGPYTIASASAASVTATLQAAGFTTANTISNSTTFTVAVTSSAGNSSSNNTTSTVVTTYIAETPYSAPGGTFTPVNKFGVNLAGGENTGVPPYGQLPANYELQYFAGKGFGLIRLPITSQFAATTAFGLLNSGYMNAINSVIQYAVTQNLYVVIDPHEYGNSWNSVTNSFIPITPGTNSANLFTDLWSRLATKWKNYPNVMFGLMNEPSVQTAAQWQTCAANAITAIRAAGANQLITIPGVGYTNAAGWVGNGNGTAWAGFAGDSQNNFVFEMHQYLDAGNSGGSPVATQNGSTVLASATSWLATNGFKAVLFEFGLAPDPWYPLNTGANINNYDPTHSITLTTNSVTQNSAMLTYMQSNSGQWVGWAEWAGGVEFSAPPQIGGYTFNPEPARSGAGYTVPIVDQPQISVLQPYLFLLKRDLDPSSNDNDPMWLEKAA